MQTMQTLQREVNQELWTYIMTEPHNGEYPFENDVFQIKPYSWGDAPNDWHFYHKPSGLKVYWYKYPLRGATVNMNITPEQFRTVLYDCMNSVHPQFTTMITKWWKNEGRV
jgi:hypothetical protein